MKPYARPARWDEPARQPGVRRVALPGRLRGVGSWLPG